MTKEFLQMDDAELNGFTAQRRNARANRVASATALWADTISGRVPSYFLKEAIAPRTPALMRAIESNYPGIIRMTEAQTTSDFPQLTGDVLDRMMMARYQDFPKPWRQYARVTTVNDFRDVKRIPVDGLEGRYDVVPEQAEIKYKPLTDDVYQYAPQKYARGAKLSFEAIMNDDLDAFETIPDRLGRGGARTIGHFAASLWLDTNGPNATFFDVSQGNRLTGNPALSVTALSVALGLFKNMKDSEGEPIWVEEAVLVVSPSLWVTAQNIMNQIHVDVTAGETNRTVRTENWVVRNLSLVVEPYIPIVASNANGATTWGVFAAPSTGRPALEVGLLRGFQEPQLYQKLADTRRVGGDIDQMAGDFLTMSTEYKGVVGFGGTRLDWRGAVASNGSGS